MIAVFYDRKNRCTVTSEQLMTINLCQSRLRVITAAAHGSEWQGRKKEKTFIDEEQVANLGYQSPKCPTSQNWDVYTTINDLVFLRLESK